jgi:hypothetical protein
LASVAVAYPPQAAPVAPVVAVDPSVLAAQVAAAFHHTTSSRKRAREERRAHHPSTTSEDAASPGTSGSDEPQPTDAEVKQRQLKRKRLARKAELARDSRLKKKQRLMELEDEVASLKAQLAKAKESVELPQVGPTLDQLSTRQAARIKEGLASAVLAGATYQAAEDRSHLANAAFLSAARARLTQATDAFQLASVNAVDAPLQHLQALTQANGSAPVPLQFMQWILSRDGEFYGQAQQNLFATLFQGKLGASEAVTASLLKALGSDNCRLNETDVKIQGALENLHSLLQTKNQIQRKTLQHMNTALDAKQQAMLLQWVSQFGAVCVNKAKAGK